MKKIAFIAYAPGSCNALFPLIDPLKEEYEIDLFAFHEYGAKLWGTEVYDLNKYEDIFNTKYDLIITGTDAVHKVEKMTSVLGSENNIPVLSILDLKGNYKLRYENEPDYIICIDEESKIDIIFEGISPSKIFPLGNPHFDRLKEYIGFYPIKPPYNVSFFSQPLEKSKEAFYYLLKVKDNYPKLINKIYIKAHPLEDDSWIDKSIKYDTDIEKVVDENPLDILLDTDVSVGLNSTVLYEAKLIGKHSIYYKNELKLFNDFLNLHNRESSFKISSFNSTQKCIDFITKIINNN